MSKKVAEFHYPMIDEEGNQIGEYLLDYYRDEEGNDIYTKTTPEDKEQDIIEKMSEEEMIDFLVGKGESEVEVHQLILPEIKESNVLNKLIESFVSDEDYKLNKLITSTEDEEPRELAEVIVNVNFRVIMSKEDVINNPEIEVIEKDTNTDIEMKATEAEQHIEKMVDNAVEDVLESIEGFVIENKEVTIRTETDSGNKIDWEGYFREKQPEEEQEETVEEEVEK